MESAYKIMFRNFLNKYLLKDSNGTSDNHRLKTPKMIMVFCYSCCGDNEPNFSNYKSYLGFCLDLTCNDLLGFDTTTEHGIIVALATLEAKLIIIPSAKLYPTVGEMRIRGS